MTESLLTAQNWPIAASTLPFADATDDADGTAWAVTLREIADAGFDYVDLTDGWVRPADLDAAGLDRLMAAGRAAGVRFASISAIRRSVLDARSGGENLHYSHRTIDAAAALGIGTVSVGLHQALTEAQRAALWFWTVPGHQDRPEDFPLAVARLRELGQHAAEVGVVLSLELYEDTFLGSADSAIRLVEEIGLDAVGLNPDIGNLIRLHRPVESWRELVDRTLPYANFWHVKNYARDEDAASERWFAVPAPMESGLIDYRYAIKRAVASGFQGVICTENYGGDGLSVSAANRDYLTRHALPKRADYDLGASKVRQPDLTGLLGERA